MKASPDPRLDADMHDFPAAYARPGGCFLVVENPQTGALAAMCGLLDGTVRRLHVAESWRGRQLARQLVLRLLQEARDTGLRSVSCVVATANQPAQTIFRQCGFQPTGRRPAHPWMAHCEVLELPFPPLASPPAMLISGNQSITQLLNEQWRNHYQLVIASPEWGQTENQSAGGFRLLFRPKSLADLEFLASWCEVMLGGCACVINDLSVFPGGETGPEILDQYLRCGYWTAEAFEPLLNRHALSRLVFLADHFPDHTQVSPCDLEKFKKQRGIPLLVQSLNDLWRDGSATCYAVVWPEPTTTEAKAATSAELLLMAKTLTNLVESTAGNSGGSIIHL
jgi:RimJ/RimL family protein N-acetyltransferase